MKGKSESHLANNLSIQKAFIPNDQTQKLENCDCFCILHQFAPIILSECKVLLNQAKKMQSNFETHGQSYPKVFKNQLVT